MNNNESTPSCFMRIKSLCEERNWNTYQLAKASGIPYSSINNMFIRETEPSFPTLRKLCYGLNISLAEFFSDNDINVISIDDELRPLLQSYNEDFTDIEKALVIGYMQAIADKHMK